MVRTQPSSGSDSACWQQASRRPLWNRKSRNPSILGPMHFANRGPILTDGGNFGSMKKTRGFARVGSSPVRRATTARSWFRSPGKASYRASTRPRARRRRAGIVGGSRSPRSFHRTGGSGSGLEQSTGTPTSGSTVGMSPSTRGDTRLSRPISRTRLEPPRRERGGGAGV